MAMTDKLKSFLSSPKGKQAMEKGRQQLSKPENQRKIRTLLNKVTKTK